MRDTLLSIGDLLDVLHDAALVVDAGGTIVFASRAVEGIFGHAGTELTGRPLDVLVPQQFRAHHGEQMARYRDHGLATPMGDRPLLHGLHRDGREVPVSISLSNLDIGDQRYTVAIVRDASPVEQQLGAARARAETDALTGLGNRLHLSRRLHDALADPSRPFTLAFVDLANFKPLNDAHGHAAGDEVLRIVARRLKSSVRDTDTAARLGGDEFVLLFVGLADGEGVRERVQALTAKLARPMRVGQALLEVRPDIGTASYPRDGRSAEDLLAHADRAMYEAKQAAKSREG